MIISFTKPYEGHNLASDLPPLLEEHNQRSHRNSLEGVLVGENVDILRNFPAKLIIASLGRELGMPLVEGLFLKFALGLDLEVFDAHQVMIDGKLSQLAKSGECLVVATLVNQESGREGEEPDTDGQRYGGYSLEDEREAPGKVVLTFTRAANIVAAIADPVG